MKKTDFVGIRQDHVDFCRGIISGEITLGQIKNICRHCPFSKDNSTTTVSICETLPAISIDNALYYFENINASIKTHCKNFLDMVERESIKPE
jgi:hypothetical protein